MSERFLVLGIVGSPRKGGNTELLIREAFKVLEAEGLETELITLYDRTVKPCDACEYCKQHLRCHITDDDIPAIYERMLKAQGIILASPVYFGSATPQMMALIDRVGYLARAVGRPLERKVGGSIVVARRAGQNFTFAQLNYFFLILGMVVPGSTYWNVAVGRRRGDVLQDEEGLATVRNFAQNMAWVIKKLYA
ncbi:MAG: flavodoxin family protein [Candidatus Bathyarchaeia archaeon]